MLPLLLLLLLLLLLYELVVQIGQFQVHILGTHTGTRTGDRQRQAQAQVQAQTEPAFLEGPNFEFPFSFSTPFRIEKARAEVNKYIAKL